MDNNAMFITCNMIHVRVLPSISGPERAVSGMSDGIPRVLREIRGQETGLSKPVAVSATTWGSVLQAPPQQ